MNREVWLLENVSVEKNEITAAQAIAMSQIFTGLEGRTIRPGSSALRE